MKQYLLIIISLLLSFSACRLDSEIKKAEPETQKAGQKATSPRIQLLGERIAQDTTNAELYFARANAFLEMKDVQSASADILLAMKNDSTQAKYYLTASDILIQSGNGTAAIRILQNGLGQLPNNTTLWLERAKLHYYLRQYDEATLSFRKLIAIEPSNPQAYFFRGLMQKEQKEIDLAIKDFETAIEHNPDFYDAMMQLGLIHLENKPKLAVAYLDNALRLDPQSTEALYAKGIVYQNDNKIEKAKESYQKIVKLDRQNPHALYNLGFIYLQQDSLEKAIKHFDMCVLVEPSYYRGYHMRGKYWETKKDFEKAATEYQNALNINPDYKEAKEGLARVKNSKQ